MDNTKIGLLTTLLLGIFILIGALLAFLVKKKDKVVVEGINIVKKHMKPNAMNQSGGILSVEAPIHVSNVKVIEEVKKEAKKTAKKSTKKEVGEE